MVGDQSEQRRHHQRTGVGTCHLDTDQCLRLFRTETLRCGMDDTGIDGGAAQTQRKQTNQCACDAKRENDGQQTDEYHSGTNADHLRVIEFEGKEIVPIKFLKALLPDPASLGPRTHGKTNIGCIFKGKKDGKEKTWYIYNVCDHQECFAEVGSQAISYTTGVPAMCGALMLLTGKWNKPGVYTVEEFDPDPFMEQLLRKDTKAKFYTNAQYAVSSKVGVDEMALIIGKNFNEWFAA